MGNLLANILNVSSSAERKARDELRAAIEGRRAAEIELQTKTEAVQKLHQIIQDADVAERAADQAEAAATSAAAAWAEAGANGDASDSVIDQAFERRRQASVARIRAKGAQQALSKVEQAKADAQLACSHSNDRIKAAVGAVLIALIEPDFARLEQARRAYLEIFNRIRAVEATEDRRGWGEASRRNLVTGISSIGEKLSGLGIPSYAARGDHTDAPDYDPNQWAQLAKRLATDPDASFEKGG
jgi:hypothetical protein